MCIALVSSILLAQYGAENNRSSALKAPELKAPEWLIVEGLVENPLNLTYAQLKNFPLVSEVTMLQCVGSGQGSRNVTYNWTGVPLFYLLSMAKVIPGDYREVVFNAADSFSSSVPLETAMDPTAILAIEANGTDLERISGFGSGYRVVFPCRWGYKWVKWVKQIIVIDYDYKGKYEQLGFPDEAIRANCTMPLTDPPIHIFNVTVAKEYSVKALCDSSIETFNFDLDKQRMTFNVSGPEENVGYFYVIFPKELLTGPYQAYADQNPVEPTQTDAGDSVYLYFTCTSGNHTFTIDGTPEGGLLKISSHGESPMKVCCLDQQNRRTGVFNGYILEQIPNSTYDNEFNIVKIRSPSGNYTVEVFGTSDGTYSLEIVNLAPGYKYTENLSNTIHADRTRTYLVRVFANGKMKVWDPLLDIYLDWKIDIRDIAAVAVAYGTHPNDPRWNDAVDVYEDGNVDIRDVAMVANQFGKVWS